MIICAVRDMHSVGSTSPETSLVFLRWLLDALTVPDFPELAARGRLQLAVVCHEGVLMSKRTAALVVVALDSRWEPYHVPHNTGLHLRLHKASPQTVLGQVLGELKAARIAKRVQAGGRVANAAHGNLLWGDGDHLFGDHVGGHDIERVEQISIVLEMSLADVVLQDLFLFWVLLEVLFESAIAH